MRKSTLVLPDIRSAYNVGSMFRTADAVGLERIILCGTTPGPVDRFGRDRKDIAKVALGSEKTIPWSYDTDSLKAISELKKQGYFLVALEQCESALGPLELRDVVHHYNKVGLVVGPEVTGLSEHIIHASDCALEIPMQGHKRSLNVSVAAGLAMYLIQNLI